jgi:hypothetical protein
MASLQAKERTYIGRCAQFRLQRHLVLRRYPAIADGPDHLAAAFLMGASGLPTSIAFQRW